MMTCCNISKWSPLHLQANVKVQKSTTSDVLDRTYMDDFGKVNNNRIKDGLLDKVRVDQD